MCPIDSLCALFRIHLEPIRIHLMSQRNSLSAQPDSLRALDMIHLEPGWIHFVLPKAKRIHLTPN